LPDAVDRDHLGVQLGLLVLKDPHSRFEQPLIGPVTIWLRRDGLPGPVAGMNALMTSEEITTASTHKPVPMPAGSCLSQTTRSRR
jgi:hypothetical protein